MIESESITETSSAGYEVVGITVGLMLEFCVYQNKDKMFIQADTQTNLMSHFELNILLLVCLFT